MRARILIQRIKKDKKQFKRLGIGGSRSQGQALSFLVFSDEWATMHRPLIVFFFFFN
jgi:hypothetical protein